MKTVLPYVMEETEETALSDEFLPAVAATLHLEKWFQHAMNHDVPIRPQPNSIYFYCGFPGTLHTNDQEVIQLQTDRRIPSVFYDWQRIEGSNTAYGSYEAIPIHVNDRPAGYYLPEISTLLLSDWTHERQTAAAAVELIPQLIEQLEIPEQHPPEETTSRFKRPAPKRVTVSVGGDPEYEWFRNKHIQNAASTLQFSGPIGTDGAGYQVELRPDPGTPEDVIYNLHYLIEEFNEQYDGVLGTGGDHMPLGGHIHLGFDPVVVGPCQPHSGLITLLDDFLGRPTQPLNGRRRGSYNDIGQYEFKPWGLEYRTPPAAIYHDPEMLHVCLKMARNLAEIYLSQTEALAYEEPPSQDDYIRLAGITYEEYKYFKNFISAYRKLPATRKRAVIATWLNIPHDERPRAVRTQFYFRDTWNEDAREAMNAALAGTRARYIHTVYLYGISASKRGIVCSHLVKGTGWPILLKPPYNRIRGDAMYIGLPATARYEEGWETYTEAIAETIKEQLSSYDKHMEKQDLQCA